MRWLKSWSSSVALSCLQVGEGASSSLPAVCLRLSLILDSWTSHHFAPWQPSSKDHSSPIHCHQNERGDWLQLIPPLSSFRNNLLRLSDPNHLLKSSWVCLSHERKTTMRMILSEVSAITRTKLSPTTAILLQVMIWVMIYQFIRHQQRVVSKNVNFLMVTLISRTPISPFLRSVLIYLSIIGLFIFYLRKEFCLRVFVGIGQRGGCLDEELCRSFVDCFLGRCRTCWERKRVSHA